MRTLCAGFVWTTTTARTWQKYRRVH